MECINRALLAVLLSVCASPVLASGVLTPAATDGGGSVTVQEEDGVPSATTSTLKFPNGSLTDNGGGSVSYTPAATTTTLDQAFDNGKIIDGANSLANAVRIGDGTTPWCIYTDASDGPQLRPCTDSNVRTIVPTNFTWCLYNVEAAECVETIDPDAASKNAMYQYGANSKTIASFYVPLSPRGAATMTETQIVSNQPKGWWGTLTDANTDAFDFHFPVTKKMEGITTITVRLWGVSDHATPSGNIELDCAAQSFRPGTDTYAAHSTTGEQAVLLTPATQNRAVSAVSAAITLNGTVAEGAEIVGSCEVDATATTSAQLTDFFLRGDALIQLLVNSRSD